MKFFKSAIPFLFFVLMACVDVFGQRPWVNAIPTYYHPSFAGSAGGLRVSSYSSISLKNYPEQNIYGNQNLISVDHFIGKIRTGIAMGVGYSKADGQFYKDKFVEGNLSIAPKISVGGKYTFSPSVQLSVYRDWFSTVPSFSNANMTYINPYPQTWQTTYATLKFGLMFNSKKFFIGGAYRNDYTYYETNKMFYNSTKFIDRLEFIAGYTFKKTDESDFSFTPVLLLGNNIYRSNLYLTFKCKKFIAGVDIFTNLMLGYESKKFRIMYIQKFPFINDNPYSSFNREYRFQLSLQYRF